jgi:hypothetical protein
MIGRMKQHKDNVAGKDAKDQRTIKAAPDIK